MTTWSLQILQTGVLCWALLGLSSALVCPDGGMCEDRNTCCRNMEGGYGCCPLPHAECCSDHLHCCYQGTVCDLVHEKCVNKTVSLPWVRRVPSKPAPLVPQAVVCPDRESECPDDTTCCQLLDGSWGCCPLAKAVCCEDKLHCCPEGTTCDLERSRCTSSSLDSAPLLLKLPARRRGARTAPPAGSVLCPGGKSSCPQSSTCCLLTSGDYGCCPYPQATCCSDHIHCCPGDTTCDLEHSACKSGGTRFPLMRKVPAARSDIVCPDEKSVCPDQTTCCQMTNGSYGCCPMPSAVCCSDHVHCCPAGTQCDLQHTTCVSMRGIEPATLSAVAPAAAAVPVAARTTGRSVPCNDSVACADGNTCCKSVEGEWACCPLAKAVCCDDHLHCCPHATVCNLAASTCDDPSGGAAATPWLSKTPAVAVAADNSKCDKSTSCPGKSTCCRTPDGDWACCPLPQAVCCDDHVHCCPHGSVCNLETQTCDDPSGSRGAWLRKVPALRGAEPGPVGGADGNACDGRTSCPRDTTCCFMSGTQGWGCCPLPDAVCCADGAHCCPSGHTCDPQRSSCSRGPLVVPWSTKLSSRAVGDVKCDDKSSCASGATCCKLPSGEWGCCPLVKAVCCTDHEHCCPQGYTCNMESGTCEKKSLAALPQTAVVRSSLAEAGGQRDVPCGGTGGFHCSQGETCCRVSETEWGCCPSSEAVCCPGSRSCCPAGSRCDVQTRSCSLNAPLSWDASPTRTNRDSAL